MKTIPTLALLLGCLTLASACRSPETLPQDPEADLQVAPNPPTTTEEGTPGPSLGAAPDFTLPTLAGDSLRLSDLRGRVVLVNFWATWCGPCVEEIPELIALYRDMEEEGLTVVGISLDEEDPDLIAPFAQRFGINYPIVVDDGAVAEAFGGVWALPTTYVIDRQGAITQRVIGLFPVEEKRSELHALLVAPPSKTTSS